MEAPESRRLQVKQPSKGYQKDKEDGDTFEDMIKKSPTTVVEETEKEEKVEDGPAPVNVMRSPKPAEEKCRKKAGLVQLSQEQLLHLLGIMEGEVQVLGFTSVCCTNHCMSSIQTKALCCSLVATFTSTF